MSIPPLRQVTDGRPVRLAPIVAEVEHALGAIERGRGGHVWTGAPGTGKSTLLDLVLEEATTSPPAPARAIVHLRPGAGAPGGATETLGAQLAAVAGVAVPDHLARHLTRPSTAERPDAACAAIVEYARTALPGATVVLVVDDIDGLDAASRTLLLHLVTHHQISAVLLATATRATWAEHLPYPMTLRRVPPLTAHDVVRLLLARHHQPTAPRVAASLARQLAGNTACILQTARELTPDQLAGRSLLPNPLPLVPALEAVHGVVLDALGDADRWTLLVAAVSVVDRTDLLLEASGRTLDEVLDGPVAELVRLAGGRFAVVDPGLRALVHERASVAERTAAHLALAAAHGAAGLAETATWHTALGALAGDPRLGPRLVAVAERLVESGDVVHAHEVAREAASQSAGGWTMRARLVAGIAALRSGHVLDADEWLQPVMRSPDPDLTSRALAHYATAVTLHTGCVPDDDVAQHVERVLADGTARDRARVVEVLGTCARLHAERGHVEASGRYLARATRMLERTRDDRAGHGRARSGDAVRATGPSGAADDGSVTDDGSAGDDPLDLALHADRLSLDAAWCALLGVGTVVDLDARTDVALDARTDVRAGPRAQPVAPRSRRRALLRLPAAAHPDQQTSARALRALTLVVDGDVEAARGSLASAVLAVAPLQDDATWRDAPGTAVSPLAEALLRTARVVVELGAADLGAASDELARASSHLPVEAVLGGLAVALARRVDVFRAEDDGDLGTALAAGPTPTSAVVRREALVDSVLLAERAGEPCAASAELELVAGTSPAPWDVLLPGLGDGAVGQRARAETLTATSLHRARRQLAEARAARQAGDAAAAHEHLLAAAELFGACGALAWRTAALRESDRAAVPVPLPVLLRDAPSDDGAVLGDGTLTPRELDVAQLVVQGASNRDVARALHLSVRTVEVHLGRVFRKLGARSRVELTVLAHRGTHRADARSS